MNAYLRLTPVPDGDTWQLSIEVEASGVTVQHALPEISSIDGIRISMKTLNDSVVTAKNELAEAVKRKRDELSRTLQELSPMVADVDLEA